MKMHASRKPVNLQEYAERAKEKIAKNAFDYYASGANDMITLAENKAAFARLKILPRMLRGAEHIDTTTKVLGDEISSPICVAPTAMQKMAHPDGELATARACASHNTLMTLSSWSTTSLEDVNDCAPDGLRWFQLYVYKDRKVSLDLIRRAERSGYKAIAVTVDTPILGRREPDLRNGFSLPSHLTMANFVALGGDHSSGTKKAGGSGSGLASYVASLVDKQLTWEVISWLRSVTKLKIVVKGVLTAEDAATAAWKYGVDGIWVSNHGARQLDTAPATIEVLRPIAAAVEGSGSELYIDGGISRGTDVFKCLALGAKAVFIGRPVLWGLSVDGQEGVQHVIELLKSELALAMALSGCNRLSDINPEMITTSRRLEQISRL